MRPKLRSDVRYVPSGAGVRVFSTAGSFELAGASVETLLDHLVGHLDGTHTMDSIVEGLPARHQRVVTKLVDTLLERRVAYDAAAELPHRLEEWELVRYPQEVAYAERAAGSGAHRFERFRLAKVLLVGAGGGLDALVGTMLQMGARGAAVLTVPGRPGGRDRHHAMLVTCQRDDPLLELAEVPDPGRWESAHEIRSWLTGYHGVLHCDDRPSLALAARLNRAARAAGVPALHAVTAGGSAWVGPVAGADLGCWECAWRHLVGSLSSSDPHWADHQLEAEVRPGPDLPPAPILSMVGAMLAMTYFRYVTEAVAGAATNRLVRIELETATAQEHRFVRHPGCQACPAPEPPTGASVAGGLAAARARPVRTDQELSGAAAALCDPALGTVLSLDETDHPQLPLVVTVATVNDLTGSGAGPRSVAAAAPDHPGARRRAAVRALETAAGLATAARPGADAGWAWDVIADVVVPAPAAADPADRAVAAGHRWAEAVGRGLLRHLARLISGERRVPGRPLAEPLPEHARGLLDAAEVMGVRLRVEDRTDRSGQPAVAVHGAGPVPVAATALDLPGALVAALEAVLGRLQRELAPGRGGHPAPVGPATGEIPADLGDQRWPDHLARVAASLAARGYRPLARPLTLAPALADRLPLLAEVTLVRRPGGGPAGERAGPAVNGGERRGPAVNSPAPVRATPTGPPAARVAVLGDDRLAYALRAALGASHRRLPREPDRSRPGPRVAGARVVVVTETAVLPAGLDRVTRWLRGHRLTGLPVHTGWDVTTVGPLLPPDRPGCYLCARTRMGMARSGASAAERELWRRFTTGRLRPPDPVLTAPVLATLAALVTDECDRLRADRPSRIRDAVLRVRPDPLTIDRHRFLPDPACEVCGAVPDDAAALAVVTLRHRPKADRDGCRTGRTPSRRELVERFVDSHTGLIHSVQVEYSGTTVNATAAINTGGDGAGEAPVRTATGGARSCDRDSSVAVAILEALERYAGLTADLGKRTVVRASYRDLPEDEAIDPYTLGLPRPEPPQEGYVPYRPDLRMPWVWGWSFRRERPVLVPESIGYYYRRQEPAFAYECSSGCALGSCLEEAILHGIFEVAERDGFLLTWYARLPVPRIDWRSVQDPVTRLLAARLEATTGDRLYLLDTTMPEGIPSVAAMVVDEAGRPGYAKAFFGGGAHLCPERAVRGAVREVALSDGRSPLPAEQTARARAMLADPDLVTELEHHGWVYCLPESWPRLAFLRDGPEVSLAEAFPPGHRRALSADLTGDLRHAVDRYLGGGLDVVVVDQTVPEHRAAGLTCAKVVIPGTLPMTFGHRHRRAVGIPRLHTVPARLGYRAGPLPAAEVNPHPHPFR